MIVRNEVERIQGCLESIIQFIHELVIVDTGSTDDTEVIVTSLTKNHQKPLQYLHFTPDSHPESFAPDTEAYWGTHVPGPYSGKTMLIDFAAARNHGWVKATSDFKMWIDADDIVEHAENLPGILEEMRDRELDGALLNYDYAFSGNIPTCQLRRERISHSKFPTRWEQPIHEVFGPLGRNIYFEPDRLNIAHKQQRVGSSNNIPNRNLKILHKQYQQGQHKQHHRILFYLGNETQAFDLDKAADYFSQYIDVSGWDEERALARYMKGRILETRKALTDAFAEYSAAHLDFSDIPEPFFGLARIEYLKENWKKCVEFHERAIEIRERSVKRRTLLMYNPLDRYFTPNLYASRAYLELSQPTKAKACCIEGLKYEPEHPILTHNLDLANKWERGDIKISKFTMRDTNGHLVSFGPDDLVTDQPKQIPQMALVICAIELWKRIIRERGQGNALEFLNTLPKSLQNESQIQAARTLTQEGHDLKDQGESASSINPDPNEIALFRG